MTFLYVCIPVWMVGLFVSYAAWMLLVPLPAVRRATVERKERSRRGRTGPDVLFRAHPGILRGVDESSVPWENGHGDTKGWDRASIANRSAKPYVPDISQADLTLPNEPGKRRTLGLCFLCAGGMTFLYVGIPFWVVGLFVSYPAWMALLLPVALAASTAGLYVFSTHETRELRVLAREL